MGNHGYIHLKKLNTELTNFNSKNEELEQKILNFRSKISALKNSDIALEKVAREELGLAKPEEIIYIFSDNQASKQDRNNVNKKTLP